MNDILDDASTMLKSGGGDHNYFGGCEVTPRKFLRCINLSILASVP